MTLLELNRTEARTASAAFAQCCAAHKWVQAMVAARPFDDMPHLLAVADHLWRQMREADWLEAFSAHPQIGNVDSLRAKYASTKTLAAGEQSAVSAASETTLQALAVGNQKYLAKFGFIFIVCATGKSADEMLEMLQARLSNSRDQELRNAAEEQHKITAIRLQKLLENV